MLRSFVFDFPEFDPFVPREPNVPTGPEPGDTAPTQQKPDAEACDKKLAALFGGEGAVADTGLTPSSLEHPTAGMQRFTDHSAAGGVMHLYSNAQGTAPPNSVGLYMFLVDLPRFRREVVRYTIPKAR